MEKEQVLNNAKAMDTAIDALDSIAKNLKQSGVKDLQRFGYELSDASNKVVRHQRTLMQIADGNSPYTDNNG